MTNKAYSYTRMSTAEQLKGDSRRRQVDLARQYAERAGLEIVDRYDDIGVSAYHGKNVEFGALRAFIDAVDRGVVEPGSVLIVESIDRLSRQEIARALTLLLELINKKITVVTLNPEHVYSGDTLDNMSLIGALFIMARAHEESKMKAMRGREAWSDKRNRARREGKLATRRVPAWLQVVDETIEVIQHRAEIITEVFERCRDGWGSYSIARRLNERGEPPWGGKENAVWRESYIKKLIRSRTVLGEYQPHTATIQAGKRIRAPQGEPIRGYYPAVIDLQLFQEANAALDARRKVGKGRKGKRYANLFTGLLRCHCGAGYRFIDKGAAPKGAQYLQCSVARAKGSCHMPLIRYDIVEHILLNAIDSLDARRVLDGTQLDHRLTEARSTKAGLSDQLLLVRSQIEAIVEAIANGNGSRALTTKLENLERAEALAQEKLHEVERTIEELMRLDPVERRAAVSRLLNEISSDSQGDVLAKRRALSAELQRLVEKITIYPSTHSAVELMQQPNWRAEFGVRSPEGLQRKLRERCFEAHIAYRSGAAERVDALCGPYFKQGPSRRMKEMRLINSSER